MKNIYAYFHFSWVIFFTQNSKNLFLNETKKPKFYSNKYFDMYINTFDGYESSTQCTALLLSSFPNGLDFSIKKV